MKYIKLFENMNDNFTYIKKELLKNDILKKYKKYKNTGMSLKLQTEYPYYENIKLIIDDITKKILNLNDNTVNIYLSSSFNFTTNKIHDNIFYNFNLKNDITLSSLSDNDQNTIINTLLGGNTYNYNHEIMFNENETFPPNTLNNILDNLNTQLIKFNNLNNILKNKNNDDMFILTDEIEIKKLSDDEIIEYQAKIFDI